MEAGVRFPLQKTGSSASVGSQGPQAPMSDRSRGHSHQVHPMGTILFRSQARSEAKVESVDRL